MKKFAPSLVIFVLTIQIPLFASSKRVKRELVENSSDLLSPANPSTTRERKLKIRDSTFTIKKEDNYKKLKFMKIVASILTTAKKQGIKIKKIQLGNNIKRIFQNPNLNTILQQYINDRNFFKDYKKEQRKYRKLIQLLNKQKKSAPMAKLPRKNMGKKFKFDPAFAGMPFPPFLLNGPHYYPQTEITVNALPNPHPRDEITNEDIEIQTLERQAKFLKGIKNELEKTDGAKTNMVVLKAEASKATANSRSAIKSIIDLV